MRPVLRSQSGFDIRTAAAFAVKGHASAAAGSADLWSDRAVCHCRFDKVIHLRCRDVGRETLSIREGIGENAADKRPVLGQQSQAHVNGGVADIVKDLKDLAVAVNV